MEEAYHQTITSKQIIQKLKNKDIIHRKYYKKSEEEI